jgi:hypothetical protein
VDSRQNDDSSLSILVHSFPGKIAWGHEDPPHLRNPHIDWFVGYDNKGNKIFRAWHMKSKEIDGWSIQLTAFHPVLSFNEINNEMYVTGEGNTPIEAYNDLYEQIQQNNNKLFPDKTTLDMPYILQAFVSLTFLLMAIMELSFSL